jgi:hypothetical protein
VSTTAAIIAVAMSAALLWAGLEKLRDRSAAASTIHRLGVSLRRARTMAYALASCEVGVACALLFRPGSVLALAAIVVLALVFAGAGVVALVRDETIPCACFGAGRTGNLGVNQLYALVPWLGGVAVLGIAGLEPRSFATGAAWLAATALTVASLRSVSVWRAVSEARDDRLIAQEMFEWLR